MIMEPVLSEAGRNMSYLFAAGPGRAGFVVDPPADSCLVLDIATRHNVKVAAVVLTHHHADHVGGVAALAAASGAEVLAHRETARLLAGRIRVSRHLADDEILRWGEELTARVLATPGHAPGSVCLVVNDAWLVTGDTLFIGDCGRTDLPGGDAPALFRSLQRLKALPGHLEICPGHDYGPVPRRSLVEEKRLNPTLRAASLAEFSEIP